MTDEIEQLKNALHRQTPPPSDGAKNRALAAAMESFSENIQGSPDQARPTNNRPHWVARLLEGLKMFGTRLTTRTAMLGTASLASLAVAIVVVQDQTGQAPLLQPAPEVSIDLVLDEAPNMLNDANMLEQAKSIISPTPSSSPAPETSRVGRIAEVGDIQTESFNGGQSPETDLSRARTIETTDARTQRPSAPPKAAAAAPVAEPIVLAEAEAELASTFDDPNCSDIASCLTPGMRAFTVKNPQGKSWSNLSPGDTVDIFWTGRIGPEQKPVTKLMLTKVKVIAIDQSVEIGARTSIAPKTLTVEVFPLVVATLAQAQASGEFSIAIQNSPQVLQTAQQIGQDDDEFEVTTLYRTKRSGGVVVRVPVDKEASPAGRSSADIANAPTEKDDYNGVLSIGQETLLGIVEAEDIPTNRIPDQSLSKQAEAYSASPLTTLQRSRNDGLGAVGSGRPIMQSSTGARVKSDKDTALAEPATEKPQAAQKHDGGISLSGDARLGLLYEDSVDLEGRIKARVRFESQSTSDTGLTFDFNFRDQAAQTAEANTERFPEVPPSDLKIVKTDPVSTFSIDVDTASYSFVRSSLMAGQKPNPDAVRIEEMVNYFNYDYPMPEGRDVPFQTSVSVSDTPWNEGTKLIQIAIQGYDLPAAERPNANLVFLIDTSGSMNNANKLPLLIQSFRLLLSSLSENDTVAIVTYAGSAGMALEPTPANETAKIFASLNNLHAGGSTAGHAGLQQAYALAEQMAEDGDMSRVILATDGDFNVGISGTEQLKDYISEKRDTGVYLSILGFGRGNTNDQLMQALAQNGNGTAAYIDTLAEAQKVLVDEASGALFSIAGDVKIQMEFNPSQIAEYRLIGYETRALKREDFNNDAVDAGEIGAGHTVTAIYEVTPVGSPARRIDDLRYSAADVEAIPASGNPEYGFLKLRYKLPGESRSKLIETPVMPDRADIDPSEVRFATAVAGFGEYLKGSDYLGDWGPVQIDALAKDARGSDPFGYRAEFLRLVRLSRTAQ